MTYVTEQTSAELRAHMKRLVAMPGWHEPLADRLYKEVQALDERNAELLDALRLAVRQNSHDMLMTGEELRQCNAAIANAIGD